MSAFPSSPSTSSSATPQGREMYEEISTLLGNLAVALDMAPETVAGLLEQGALRLEMVVDDDGIPCLSVAYGEGEDQKTARVYKDRIKHLRPNPSGATGP